MNLVATCFSHGQSGFGVITKDHAVERAKVTKTIVSFSSIKRRVFFFSDNHCFGYNHLPNDFVPCTSAFPIQVVPRDGLEDGWIRTIEQYVNVFHKHDKQINTIEELVSLIDQE
jgi:hypothetical protein